MNGEEASLKKEIEELKKGFVGLKEEISGFIDGFGDGAREGIESVFKSAEAKVVKRIQKDVEKEINQQMEDFGNVISEHVDSIIKDRLKGQERYVNNVVNAKLLEFVGLKWQSLLAVLTALGIYFAASFYFNNIAISSLRQDIGRLEKMIIEKEKVATHKPLKEVVKKASIK